MHSSQRFLAEALGLYKLRVEMDVETMVKKIKVCVNLFLSLLLELFMLNLFNYEKGLKCLIFVMFQISNDTCNGVANKLTKIGLFSTYSCT